MIQSILVYLKSKSGGSGVIYCSLAWFNDTKYHFNIKSAVRCKQILDWLTLKITPRCTIKFSHSKGGSDVGPGLITLSLRLTLTDIGCTNIYNLQHYNTLKPLWVAQSNSVTRKAEVMLGPDLAYQWTGLVVHFVGMSHHIRHTPHTSYMHHIRHTYVIHTTVHCTTTVLLHCNT